MKKLLVGLIVWLSAAAASAAVTNLYGTLYYTRTGAIVPVSYDTMPQVSKSFILSFASRYGCSLYRSTNYATYSSDFWDCTRTFGLYVFVESPLGSQNVTSIYLIAPV